MWFLHTPTPMHVFSMGTHVSVGGVGVSSVAGAGVATVDKGLDGRDYVTLGACKKKK